MTKIIIFKLLIQQKFPIAKLNIFHKIKKTTSVFFLKGMIFRNLMINMKKKGQVEMTLFNYTCTTSE